MLSLKHGVIYFESAKLADRVLVVEERLAVMPDGQISIRLSLVSRKGKQSLEFRCEFYDDRGASAGSVEGATLTLRDGRAQMLTLASRKAAVRYTLFVWN